MKDASLPLPDGYSSWLLYALHHFDASAAANLWMFDDEVLVSRDAIKAELWREFNALRELANLPALDPSTR